MNFMFLNGGHIGPLKGLPPPSPPPTPPNSFIKPCRMVHVRGAVSDNHRVVQYNQKLSARYDAHINIEVAASIRSVKYLLTSITPPPSPCFGSRVGPAGWLGTV